MKKIYAPAKSKKFEVQAQPKVKKGVDLKMFNEEVNDNDFEKCQESQIVRLIEAIPGTEIFSRERFSDRIKFKI